MRSRIVNAWLTAPVHLRLPRYRADPACRPKFTTRTAAAPHSLQLGPIVTERNGFFGAGRIGRYEM